MTYPQAHINGESPFLSQRFRSTSDIEIRRLTRFEFPDMTAKWSAERPSLSTMFRFERWSWTRSRAMSCLFVSCRCKRAMVSFQRTASSFADFKSTTWRHFLSFFSSCIICSEELRAACIRAVRPRASWKLTSTSGISTSFSTTCTSITQK